MYLQIMTMKCGGVITYFIFWIYVVFAIFFLLGYANRLALVIQRWLASFVFLAIYELRKYLRKNYLIEFPFYLPKNGKRRQSMNGCGALATVSFFMGGIGIVEEVFVQHSQCSIIIVILLISLSVCFGLVLILGSKKQGDDERAIDDDVEDVDFPKWPPGS